MLVTRSRCCGRGLVRGCIGGVGGIISKWVDGVSVLCSDDDGICGQLIGMVVELWMMRRMG